MQIYKKTYHICGNFLLFSFRDTTLHLMEHLYILEENLQSMNFDTGCLLNL